MSADSPGDVLVCRNPVLVDRNQVVVHSVPALHRRICVGEKLCARTISINSWGNGTSVPSSDSAVTPKPPLGPWWCVHWSSLFKKSKSEMAHVITSQSKAVNLYECANAQNVIGGNTNANM